MNMPSRCAFALLALVTLSLASCGGQHHDQIVTNPVPVPGPAPAPLPVQVAPRQAVPQVVTPQPRIQLSDPIVDSRTGVSVRFARYPNQAPNFQSCLLSQGFFPATKTVPGQGTKWTCIKPVASARRYIVY